MPIKFDIFKPFGIRETERKAFSWLYLHSFFIGFTLSFYVASVSTLFIKHHGPGTLPFAYIITGVLGYIIVTTLSRLQRKKTAKQVYLYTIILILGLVSLFFVSHFFVLGNQQAEGIHAFSMFVFVFPFFALYAIEFNGLILKIFDIQQAKRLFAVLNTGDILASLIGFFSVPFIIQFIPNLYWLLFLSITGAVGCIIVFFIIFNKFSDKLESKPLKMKPEADRKAKKGIRVKKEKYIILIFGVAFLSYLSVYFADYAFYGSIKIMKDLNVAVFISIFFGMVKLGEFSMSFLSSKLIRQFGMILGLTMLPVMMLAIVLIAALVGFLIPTEIIIFFLFIAFNKLVDRVVRKAIDIPSFKVLYQPLDEEQKIATQTRVDGSINQIATTSAGVFLILYNYLFDNPQHSIIYFTLIFIPFLALWSFGAFRLYGTYKKKLQQVLSDRSKKKRRIFEHHIYSSDVLLEIMKNGEKAKQHAVISFLIDINPIAVLPHIDNLLQSDDAFMLEKIIKTIDPTYFTQQRFERLKQIAETATDKDVKRAAKLACQRLDFSVIETLSPDDVKQHLAASSVNDKMIVIKYLLRKTVKYEEDIITQLLQEKKTIVKRAAIRLAGAKKHPVLLTQLINLVSSEDYYQEASTTLQPFGDSIIPGLEDLFKKENKPKVFVRIIKLIGRIGSQKAQDFLIRHISFPDREVRIAITDALFYDQFQANEKQSIAVKGMIRQTVNHILFLYAGINDLKGEKNTLKLINAIDLEINDNMETLFRLLSFIHEPTTIDLIRDNFRGEGSVFAMEIIENFIVEDIKTIILPLFENISYSQRIRKLDDIFPQKRLPTTERLGEIINHDFNQTDILTKIRAMELLGKLAKDGVPREIKACIFHPNEQIHNIAASILYAKEKEQCLSYLNSVETLSHEFIQSLAGNTFKSFAITEKIKILKRKVRFIDAPDKDLLKLARIMQPKWLQKDEVICFFMADGTEQVLFPVKGKLQSKETGKMPPRYEIVIKNITLADQTHCFEAKKESHVLIAGKTEFYNLLLENIVLTTCIFGD